MIKRMFGTSTWVTGGFTSSSINDQKGAAALLQKVEQNKDIYLGLEDGKLEAISRERFNQMDDEQKIALLPKLEELIENFEGSNKYQGTLNKIRVVRNELFLFLSKEKWDITKIPTDILKLILSQTYPKDVRFAKEVNKLFSHLATHQVQLQSINNGQLTLKDVLPFNTSDEVLTWITKDKQACKQLTHADFRGFSDFNDEHLKILVENCPNLNSLFIHSGNITDDGAAWIAALSNVTMLSLECSLIGDAGAASIATMSNLTTLNLRGIEIGDKGAVAIATMSNVTTLNLAGNQIGEAGAVAIATMEKVTRLNLNSNKIGPVGAASIATMPNVTALDLTRNHIGDEGAASIATMPNVTTLKLRDNQIGPAGAASIARMPNVTTLNLRNLNSQIGDVGAASIATMPNVTTLDLWGNDISDKGAASLAKMPNVTTLKLRGNNIGDAGKALLRAMPKVRKLFI